MMTEQPYPGVSLCCSGRSRRKVNETFESVGIAYRKALLHVNYVLYCLIVYVCTEPKYTIVK